MIQVDLRAHALRLVRTKERENAFQFYGAVTFPDNARNGVELCLRRCEAFGFLGVPSAYTIDVLDVAGDIIQDFEVSREGARWLRRTLRLAVEEGVSDEAVTD